MVGIKDTECYAERYKSHPQESPIHAIAKNSFYHITKNCTLQKTKQPKNNNNKSIRNNKKSSKNENFTSVIFQKEKKLIFRAAQMKEERKTSNSK